MHRSNQQLRADALAIWQAGVAAVDSARLVQDHVRIDGEQLSIGDEYFSLRSLRKIVVIGAGKAGAGMADGFERVLGDRWLTEKDVSGWVNVPEDCVRPLKRIHLHGARPAGVNEPMEAGVAGATKILELVDNLTPDDLCVCLISGGGSALLPAPVPGITLADKQAITKHLSAAGANIRELNTVRKQLSRIKGGGLARACRAGHLVTLIISDVLGDPLDVISSGPTVADTASAADALDVLRKFGGQEGNISPAAFRYLSETARQKRTPAPIRCAVTNVIIGNNATAVDAAGMEAERRGYSHAMIAARELEGSAETVGRHHAEMAWRMRHEPGPDALITGGEPTVQLVDSSRRGKGGRNQQLVLAALQQLIEVHASAKSISNSSSNPLDGVAILSGGTDGEDGPTDAAGAFIDAEVFQAMLAAGKKPADSLARNDAYHFFEPLHALIKTGPTHTNVCDLRVVVTNQTPAEH